MRASVFLHFPQDLGDHEKHQQQPPLPAPVPAPDNDTTAPHQSANAASPEVLAKPVEYKPQTAAMRTKQFLDDRKHAKEVLKHDLLNEATRNQDEWFNKALAEGQSGQTVPVATPARAAALVHMPPTAEVTVTLPRADEASTNQTMEVESQTLVVESQTLVVESQPGGQQTLVAEGAAAQAPSMFEDPTTHSTMASAPVPPAPSQQHTEHQQLKRGLCIIEDFWGVGGTNAGLGMRSE